MIAGVLIACLGMVHTHTIFMIRTKLAKLNISPIRLHYVPSVRIPSSVKTFCNMRPTISNHLLSGSILNHLMHSKVTECVLLFLSAMPRDVSAAHIYVLKLPLHHL